MDDPVYTLWDIQGLSGVKLVRRIDDLAQGRASYENLNGVRSVETAGDIARRQIAKYQQKVAFRPLRWIKDCWRQEHGMTLPPKFKNEWALAQMIFDLCKAKDISPASMIRSIPRVPRSGVWEWLLGAKKWRNREDGEESFDQWCRRIEYVE